MNLGVVELLIVLFVTLFCGASLATLVAVIFLYKE
jgi:hypothetical protein